MNSLEVSLRIASAGVELESPANVSSDNVVAVGPCEVDLETVDKFISACFDRTNSRSLPLFLNRVRTSSVPWLVGELIKPW